MKFPIKLGDITMKKPKEKIKVQKSQIYYLHTEFYKLEDLKSTIETLLYEGWYGLTIGKDYHDDPENFDPYVTIYCDRDETEQEFNQRVKLYEIHRDNLKKSKIKREREKVELEKRERQLLEKLKLKYEPINSVKNDYDL